MSGYPYRRLADPRQVQAPTPSSVAQMLAQRSGLGSPTAQAMGGAPMGGPPMMPDGSMAHEQAESGAYEAQEGPEGAEGGSPMGGMGMMPLMGQQRIPARGMEGDYDPTVEHSPSSTRIALDLAVRAAMGRMVGSERSPGPSGTRERLTRLGMPPLEVDLALQSGHHGDVEE